MRANIESMYWMENKDWYRINRESFLYTIGS